MTPMDSRACRASQTMTKIQTLAYELNKKSARYQIGGLQNLRNEIKGFVRRPGSSIFSDQTIFDGYAFHHGGRSRFRLNIANCLATPSA